MTETIRCWLVDREYTDKGMFSMVYATPEGDRALYLQRSAVGGAEPPTAARDIEVEKLEPIEDPDVVERYAEEVERMRDRHGPDDEV